jgi:methylated-DNA-protein-cysteine methyltransferase related protein
MNSLIPTARERILEQVLAIPQGQTRSYGHIAILAQSSPRYVARVLAGLPEDTSIPWHRVVNAKGKVSAHNNAGGSAEQRLRLEQEALAQCIFES